MPVEIRITNIYASVVVNDSNLRADSMWCRYFWEFWKKLFVLAPTSGLQRAYAAKTLKEEARAFGFARLKVLKDDGD